MPSECQTTKQLNMLILCGLVLVLVFFLVLLVHQSVHLSANFWHVKKNSEFVIKD